MSLYSLFSPTYPFQAPYTPAQTLLEEHELASPIDVGSNSGLLLPTSDAPGQVTYPLLASVFPSVNGGW